MRCVAIALCLICASAWGQGGREMKSDTLHDPSAAFDTLYWRWVPDTNKVGELLRWERIPGRWDTVTVRVCDTVPVWTSMVLGNGASPGPKRIIMIGELRCRDSIVVTPKKVRFE